MMLRVLRSLTVCLLAAWLGAAAGTDAVPAPACDRPIGRVLNVGPQATYLWPSVAAGVATDGDVVRIAAGDYRGDVAVWRANRLTICGSGGRARLFADGQSAMGKAIWVITGANVIVERIEFHGAQVSDRNGAGIRAEGANLTVRDSGFYDNENGILGGKGWMRIERSEFARNGAGDGQSHNLYVNAIDRLEVRASWFREARVGHNLKSRAKESIVENSYLMDGPEGTSSYLADFPNGGTVTMRGNLLHKGPRAENPNSIAFGLEGLHPGSNVLELFHNTIVVTRSSGAFVSAAPGTQAVRLTANLFAAGRGVELVTRRTPAAAVEQLANVRLAAGDVPGADRVNAPDFWPLPAVAESIALIASPDPHYRADSPRPLVLRRLAPAVRVVGALQSRP